MDQPTFERPCGSVFAKYGPARVARRAAHTIACQNEGRPCSLVVSEEGLTYLELREESSDMDVIGTYSGTRPGVTERLIYADIKHHLENRS